MDLPAEHEALRAEALELAAAVRPLAARADEADAPDPAVRELLRASKLCRLVVPAHPAERVDALAVTVVREALMSASAHLDALFAMQGIGSSPIAVGGTGELRERWLPRAAALDSLAALALTEDGAGSDLRAVATTITEDGDGLVVRGTKAFISNGGVADFYCVLGREGDGYSMVLVPAGTPGLTVTPTPTIMAPHVLGDLTFDEVRVPATHRLGVPGKGFALVFATLGTFRVSVAGAAVGLGQAALDEAVRHARERRQFGQPLATIGPVGQLLARCWTELELARRFTYYAAAKATEDPRAHLHLSSMAKVGATEAAGRIVDRCVQVMGRYGLVRGTTMERLYRTARPMRLYEGASEVVLDALARKLTS